MITDDGWPGPESWTTERLEQWMKERKTDSTPLQHDRLAWIVQAELRKRAAMRAAAPTHQSNSDDPSTWD